MSFSTMTSKFLSAPAALCLLLAGCTTIPTGPSVMVLPGAGASFGQFNYDDGACREWSAQRIGTTGADAAAESTVTGAAIGTAVGAATGAAIGAAAGDPATGAAVGSGVGLLGGTAAGAERGAYSEWELQRRYDIAYMQCMYARGHRIPVPRGFQEERRSANDSYVPPPPRGRPPAPPPPPPY
jgi:hypothetical protein